MAESEIKAMYFQLLESGDLTEMFPLLTGDWDADRKQFTALFNQNEDALEDLDLRIDNIIDDEWDM